MNQPTSPARHARRRAATWAIVTVDLAALLVGAYFFHVTRDYFRTEKEPDPLAVFGYIQAAVTVAPAALSLLLLVVAPTLQPKWRSILDGLAAFLAIITAGWLLLVGLAYFVDGPAENSSTHASISERTG